MEQRTLGRTGELVSILALGSAALIDKPHAAASVLGEALDLGITLVDTAPDYGQTEELIGRFLAHRRAEFFLATKCGCTPSADSDQHDFSRSNVRRCVEDSLRRTRSDYLDLVQLHGNPARDVLVREESVEELRDLRDEGKVRFLGYSGSGEHLAQNLTVDAFDVFQIPFSMLEPDHEALITDAADRGSGVLLRGGAGRGIALTPEQITALPLPWHPFLQARPDKWTAARLDEIDAEETPTSLMIRFSLGITGATSVLVGTADTRHLEHNVRAARKGALPDDLHGEIRRRLGL